MAPAQPSCSRTVHAVGSTDRSETPRTEQSELVGLTRLPWSLRVRGETLTVRPSSARDIAAVAQMNHRCSARSLLDRYHSGGRPPTVAALDWALRNPQSFVAVRPNGAVVGHVATHRDPAHGNLCAEVELLVEDRWQHLGVGTELMTHIAGVAQVSGYTELIAYPATAVPAAQRLMIEIGRTRMVPDVRAHLHTYLPDGAALGLGTVRERLAG